MSAQTTTTTTTPKTTPTSTTRGRLEVGGILLLMAGFGYINGNFMQPTDSGFGVFIDAVHFLPLATLLWLGIGLLRPSDEASATSARRRGLRVGVTILAVLSVITSLVMIGLGTFAPSLGVGVQAFSDWMAVILGCGGALMWFATLLPQRAGALAPVAERIA